MGHDSSSDLDRTKEGYIHSSHRMLISDFKTWLWLKNKYGVDADNPPPMGAVRNNIRKHKAYFFAWLRSRHPSIKEYHLNGRHCQSS
jgi:hypothetical protein